AASGHGHRAAFDRGGCARRRSADDDEYRQLPADAGGAAARHAGVGGVREAERDHLAAAVRTGQDLIAMKSRTVAVVGAAETTKMGKIPDVSVIGLHADAALNTLKYAGLTSKDIDGVACAGLSPVELAHYMGITPTWADGTAVGGCSFMLHVRHAAAAINEGLCNTVLITHGESGRSRVGAGGWGAPSRQSLQGQFEAPYGPSGPPSMFTIPVLRYMQDLGL